MSNSDKDIEYTLVLDGHFISSELKNAGIDGGGTVIARRAPEPAKKEAMPSAEPATDLSDRVQIPQTRAAEEGKAAGMKAAETAKAAAETPAKAAQEPKEADPKEEMDRLYYQYEKMCFSLPTVVDKDDAYPHSYHWRLGDRYDPGKMAVLKEAVDRGVKIEVTDAYQIYVEDVKNRKFKPVSWD